MMEMSMNGLVSSDALGHIGRTSWQSTILFLYSLVSIFEKPILGWLNDRFDRIVVRFSRAFFCLF